MHTMSRATQQHRHSDLPRSAGGSFTLPAFHLSLHSAGILLAPSAELDIYVGSGFGPERWESITCKDGWFLSAKVLKASDINANGLAELKVAVLIPEAPAIGGGTVNQTTGKQCALMFNLPMCDLMEGRKITTSLQSDKFPACLICTPLTSVAASNACVRGLDAGMCPVRQILLGMDTTAKMEEILQQGKTRRANALAGIARHLLKPDASQEIIDTCAKAWPAGENPHIWGVDFATELGIKTKLDPPLWAALAQETLDQKWKYYCKPALDASLGTIGCIMHELKQNNTLSMQAAGSDINTAIMQYAKDTRNSDKIAQIFNKEVCRVTTSSSVYRPDIGLAWNAEINEHGMQLLLKTTDGENQNLHEFKPWSRATLYGDTGADCEDDAFQNVHINQCALNMATHPSEWKHDLRSLYPPSIDFDLVHAVLKANHASVTEANDFMGTSFVLASGNAIQNQNTAQAQRPEPTGGERKSVGALDSFDNLERRVAAHLQGCGGHAVQIKATVRALSQGPRTSTTGVCLSTQNNCVPTQMFSGVKCKIGEIVGAQVTEGTHYAAEVERSDRIFTATAITKPTSTQMGSRPVNAIMSADLPEARLNDTIDKVQKFDNKKVTNSTAQNLMGFVLCKLVDCVTNDSKLPAAQSDIMYERTDGATCFYKAIVTVGGSQGASMDVKTGLCIPMLLFDSLPVGKGVPSPAAADGVMPILIHTEISDKEREACRRIITAMDCMIMPYDAYMQGLRAKALVSAGPELQCVDKKGLGILVYDRVDADALLLKNMTVLEQSQHLATKHEERCRRFKNIGNVCSINVNKCIVFPFTLKV